MLSTGKNFRTTASELAAGESLRISPAELERWVEREAEAVTAHLSAVLRPDPSVIAALQTLAGEFELAVVSSSARRRIDTSLHATGLARLFPSTLRFSAEDSLDAPAGKPNPAVYVHAVESLALTPEDCVAVEDSAPGVEAAVGAGIPTIGMLTWVPEVERSARARELDAAGAWLVAERWSEVPPAVAGRLTLEAAS